MNIHGFWQTILAQDRAALKLYFHPDAYINWYCTNEHFTVDEFIQANCDYPGDWAGQIERIEDLGDLVITVTHVYPTDKSTSFHVTSFLKIKADKIVSMDEYWADDGPAPQWRKDMHIGTRIK